MRLKECGIRPALNLTPQRRELLPHGTLDFPCGRYAECYTPDPGHGLPWHWHDDLEIIYISSGEMTAEIPGHQYRLTAGDCIAFNSGILHSGSTTTLCEIRSMVFSPVLVTGGKDTVFAKKYLSPLIGCSAFRAWVFDRDTEAAAIHSFIAAYRALAQAAPGYEFAVRDHLSAVCLALCRRFTDNFQKVDVPHRNQDEYRVQQMLTYIQKNFAHSITVGDIAGAAGIGERECLRCFQKTIHVPPIQYLLKYRIMQGAEALLARPTDSIAEIAVACGFDSPSNFSQHFRRFYNCTPREYRSRSV